LEINKILIAKVEDVCAFCGVPEDKVPMIFVGCSGKAMCSNCVQYIREEMGLIPKRTLVEQVLDNV